MPEGDATRELFTQFVSLRQVGQSREEAWQQIEGEAAGLPPQERQRLAIMLRRWEASDGQEYRPANDPFDTQEKPPPNLAARRNVIRRIKPGEAVVDAPQPGMVECPACHKPNAPGALHCYSCGTILKTVPNPANATQPLGASNVDNAYFGDNWALYLKVQGTGETVRIYPRQSEMILGRKSSDSVMVPDIDLTPYGAEDRGVSRLHASLRRQDETLVLTDLESVNHTFINGQRLHAHEVRVLRDGDEIRLGRLVMYAYFRES